MYLQAPAGVRHRNPHGDALLGPEIRLRWGPDQPPSGEPHEQPPRLDQGAPQAPPPRVRPPVVLRPRDLTKTAADHRIRGQIVSVSGGQSRKTEAKKGGSSGTELAGDQRSLSRNIPRWGRLSGTKPQICGFTSTGTATGTATGTITGTPSNHWGSKVI